MLGLLLLLGLSLLLASPVKHVPTEVDWHLPLIGFPISAADNGDNIVVATDKGIVAELNPAGELGKAWLPSDSSVWRVAVAEVREVACAGGVVLACGRQVVELRDGRVLGTGRPALSVAGGPGLARLYEEGLEVGGLTSPAPGATAVAWAGQWLLRIGPEWQTLGGEVVAGPARPCAGGVRTERQELCPQDGWLVGPGWRRPEGLAYGRAGAVAGGRSYVATGQHLWALHRGRVLWAEAAQATEFRRSGLGLYLGGAEVLADGLAPARDAAPRWAWATPVLASSSGGAAPRLLRRQLMSYVNPGLAVVAAERATGLAVLLADQHTGSVLYNTEYRGATLPFASAVHGSLAVYAFTIGRAGADKLWRYQLVSAELSLPADWGLANFSADDRLQPNFLTQAFYFPSQIVALTISQTARGITGREVLALMANGDIYAIDYRWIDPRRPDTATPEAQAEGVIPYNASLPYFSKNVINYYNKILAPAGITSGPTSLESTTAVFAFGADLFYTEITPSGPYDGLADDFQYSNLMLTVVGLTILTLLTGRMAREREPSQAWK